MSDLITEIHPCTRRAGFKYRHAENRQVVSPPSQRYTLEGDDGSKYTCVELNTMRI